MKPSYSAGRYFVKASGFSYMWLSASNTGKSRSRDGMIAPFSIDQPLQRPARIQRPAWTTCGPVNGLTVVFPNPTSAGLGPGNMSGDLSGDLGGDLGTGRTQAQDCAAKRALR